MNTAVYSRTIVVKADGTPAQNGSALISALAAIGGESVVDRYLLQLEPGTYDLGNATLEMDAFIDIQGAGMLSTTITSTAYATISVTSAHDADFAATARASIRNIEIANANAGTDDFSNCVQIIEAQADLDRVLLSPRGSTSFGRRGLSVFSGNGTASNVNLNNCSIVDAVQISSQSQGIFFGGTTPSALTLTLVHIDISRSSDNNLGIFALNPGSVAARYCTVRTTPSVTDSAAIIVGSVNGGPTVQTFHSFLKGERALVFAGGSSMHTGTAFEGARTGFTNAVNAFFSYCTDFTTGVPRPITNTYGAVLP